MAAELGRRGADDAMPGHGGAHPAQRRIDGLTGIRAIAALWVVAFHFAKAPFGSLHLEEQPFIQMGYLGVDLFFLLSGFIITYVHLHDAGSLAPPAVMRFYGLRLARLYPVHLAILLGLGLLVVVGRKIGMAPHQPEDFRAIDFVYNLLLVHAWGFADDIHWNFPAWSISCEWFVYLLFPVLAAALLRIRSRRQALFWLAVETAAFALAYALFFRYDLDNKFDAGGFSRFALTRVVFEFTAGALCCTLTGFVDLRRWPWTAIVLAGVAAVALLIATPMRDFAVVVVFMLAILAGSYRGNLIAGVLGHPVLVYLGEISYSLYMVHAPMRMTVGRWVEPRIAEATSTAKALAIGAGFCVATLALAALTYHVIEAPARSWLRRRVIDPATPRTAGVALAPGEERGTS